jgi:hypothetical protein
MTTIGQTAARFPGGLGGRALDASTPTRCQASIHVLAQKLGIGYERLIGLIVESARQRHGI